MHLEIPTWMSRSERTDRNFPDRYIYPSGSRGAIKSNMATTLSWVHVSFNINKFVVENRNVYETVTIIILTGYTTNVQISSHNEIKKEILLESVEKLIGYVQGKERMISILCFDFKIAWYFIKTDYYYQS